MVPLSRNQQKRIRSLARKKNRDELGIFMVEGDKMVREVLDPESNPLSFEPVSLIATRQWLGKNRVILDKGMEILEVEPGVLRQVSTQKAPNQAIALLRKQTYQPDAGRILGGLSVGLETIQDPGNLGTIIRTSDWFGIRDIFCSGDCAELYNPKTIASTMGSFLRVRVHRVDLKAFLGQLREASGKDPGSNRDENTAGKSLPSPSRFQVLATDSRGEDLFECSLPERGILLLGNESRGLSGGLKNLADRCIRIPRMDPGMHPESLNVASAAAILCAEFRRRA